MGCSRTFVLVLLSWIFFASSTLELGSYETQVLLQLRKHLEYPLFLDVWENLNDDLCNFSSPPHMSIKCENDSVTELRIMGDKPAKVSEFNGLAISNKTLSQSFSIDSFVVTLTRLLSLRVLSLVSLGIWGPLPDKFHRLYSLEALDLSSNFIFGSIPPKMSRLVKLQTLTLDGNLFNETIPEWLNSLTNLTRLSLKNNRLKGQVPSSVFKITTLTEIVLSHNLLSGNLPDLRDLSNLQLLDLRENNFDSELPFLPKGLANVFLSNNLFSGSIPEQFDMLNELQHLDLSKNLLSGTPPAALFSLPRISYLNLSSNILGGSLPQHLKCGDALSLVDLSDNRLMGRLPNCLDTGTDNRIVKIGGNCFSIDGKNQQPAAFCKEMDKGKGQSTMKKIAILACVIGGVVIIVAILLGVGLLFFCKRHRAQGKNIATKVVQDDPPTGISSELLANARVISRAAKLGTQSAPTYRVFSIEELEEATKNFDQSAILGEGSMGKVFKGRLEDGTFVAVRSLALYRKHSIRNLKLHLDLLSKLSHHHLVGLLGHCIDGRVHDDVTVGRLFLVCEFVSNGNFRSCLSGKGNISRIYDVCRAFYRPEKEAKTLTTFFMEFKKTYEELNMLLPFSSDIKVQQAQREQMAVMSFLGALPSEFDTAKSQILSGSDITSLQEVFSRVLRTESTSSNLQSSILVANRGVGSEIGRRSNNRGDKGDRGGNYGSTSEITCYYCREPGHTKRYCKKLQHRNQRDQNTVANVAAVAATSSSSSAETVTISVEEYAKLSQHQESMKEISPVVESGKKCLISSSNKWVIDSGATDHMTGNPKIFSGFRSHPVPSKVTIADGSNYTIQGSGTVKPTSSITLSSVLSLPSLSFNLISVSRLTKDLNCCISFFPDHCLFQDLMTKQTIGKGHVSDGLYILDAWVPRSIACSGVASMLEAHCRLGHPSLPVLKKLCPQFHDISLVNCESCHFAKHHRSSLSSRINRRADFAFELVHSDVWGPCPVVSKTGFRYFVTFVDDFSRMTWIYFMKNRSEVFGHFSTFCAEIKTQFNMSVHVLRSDNAKEYMSRSFQTYMNQHGILHQSSCVDTPAQNGVAERKNRHLLETARALLFQMKVPKPFWADAISTACFLINRMPSTVLKGDVPYHVLYPTKPLFPIEPKIFGSTCFVLDVRPHLTKLDPKALKCVFLGYSRLQKGYRCYSPDLHKYLVSTDVAFSEQIPFFASQSESNYQGEDDVWLKYDIHSLVPNGPADFEGSTLADSLYAPVSVKPSNVDKGPSSDVEQSESVNCLGEQNIDPPATVKPPIIHVYSRRLEHHDTCPAPALSSSDPPPTDLDLPIGLRKGTRLCTLPKYPIANFVSYDSLSSSSRSLIVSLDSVSTPHTVKEALSHPGWHKAMLDEIQALDDNQTWDLVHLPEGKKAIGCKWVFSVKFNADGSVARLKARLVAKGFAQTYGVDYSDTFSPVAKLTSVRLFISLASSENWPLHQLDIKNAFLHGDLIEEVYMEQPPGFVAQGEYGKVCHLKKSLYGLKQSPRAWFGKFSEVAQEFGLHKSKCDHSVFYRKSITGIILLVVYVDDIIITGDDYTGITSLKTFLQTKFHTKDLGQLKYFLGIEVTRSNKGIFLSQRKYVLDLLAETGKVGVKPCNTPMNPSVQLMKDDGDHFNDPEKYRRLVGRLNYLTVTRPDIAYAVSIVSQFMSEPTTKHWAALEQILCYLKGAPGLGLLYKNHGHFRIECFSDADWGGSKQDRKSTTGYCIFVGGNLISWKSKKQSVVSRSSAESEYRAMAQSTCEVMWICHLLDEINLKPPLPAKLWCDNQAAIHIASNPVYHERTKHIEIDCHFIREKIQENLISTGYVRTGEQLGDIFTKSLNGTRVEYLCNKLGMINIYAPA